MLRISVSDLETIRYWRASEDSKLEDLVARLTHADPPSFQMEAGAAMARLFEFATPRAIDEWTDGETGWNFRFEIGEERFVLPAVRELKAEVVFQTPSGAVTLVGKVDGLDGLTVHDQKLTEKFDAERYVDSLQWRSYLVMFGAKAFTYDVFVGKYDAGEVDGVRTLKSKTVTIREYHALTFYAYPGIRADVERAVAELADVIVRYNIPNRGVSHEAPAIGAAS